MKRATFLTTVFACLVITNGILADTLNYSVRTLAPLLGNVRTMANDISNTGTIIGLSINSSNNYIFARWTAEGIVSSSPEVWAINNLDQTVGRDTYGRIVMRDAYQKTLATYVNGVPSAINDWGAVLGTEYTSARTGLCYWAPNLTKYEIGLLPGCTRWTSGATMNNNGEVVGVLQTSDGNFKGAYWSVATGLVDISSIVNRASFLPAAINDRGVIVGTIRSGYDNAAFWDPKSGMHNLTTGSDYSYGQAYDINNAGQVVGITNQGPVVWSADGTMHSLNALVAGLSASPDQINDNGIITGWSYRDNTSVTAVVWTPVPEPSSLAGLAGGMLALAAFRNRRKHH